MLAPVAQLDRALPSEGRGHRFKSYRVRHFAIPRELQEHRAKLFQRKSTAVLTSIVLLLFFNSTAAESPTIASTSLCGDSYLQALAPHHVSALSWQSRSSLSRASEAQRKLPQLWDDPEVLIGSNADIILFGAGEDQTGTPKANTIQLTWGEDFENLKTNAKSINEALNLDSDIVDNWSRRIEALSRVAEKRTHKPKVLYISRSGGSAGKGTLVDAAITAAGGVNIATTSGWFTPDPEEIIAYEPDLIIKSYFKNGYESVQSTALRHKVVQRFIAKHPSVEIDGNLWPCAGPGLIEAAELISKAIDELP